SLRIEDNLINAMPVPKGKLFKTLRRAQSRAAISSRIREARERRYRVGGRVVPLFGHYPWGGKHSRSSQLCLTERFPSPWTITDRSITFCSSRMFPGQGYRVNASMVSAETASIV